MISRLLKEAIAKRWEDKKVIIITGPRQAGKTTLLKELTQGMGDVLWWNGDEFDIRNMLENPTSTRLAKYIGKNKVLIIDEAQRIENIGLCLKLIFDNIPDVKVVAIGSSSFELSNKINEPLTGRKWEFTFFPFSFAEMAKHQDLLSEGRLLEHRMIYGYYPDVVNNPGDEQAILGRLADSYLYKDILTWEKILKPDRLEKLVQALAFQVGQLVSYNELDQITGLSSKTVEQYLLMLERAFIVFRLNSFSRNLRNEIKKSRKVYFYDNGLRNAVIQQFKPLNLRSDIGALWENFMVSERMKYISQNNLFSNRYFWRNHAQNEIDYLEERGGNIYAYEFKWSAKSKSKFPKAFIETYHPAETMTIHQGNYQTFIYE